MLIPLSTFITLNKQMCFSFGFPSYMLRNTKTFSICPTSQQQQRRKKNYKLSANSLPHGIIIFFPFIYISYIYVFIIWYHLESISSFFIREYDNFCHTITKNTLCSIIFFHEIIAEHKNLWVCLWHISNLTFSLCIKEGI